MCNTPLKQASTSFSFMVRATPLSSGSSSGWLVTVTMSFSPAAADHAPGRGLQTARRKILSALGMEQIDIFFAEYVNPGDDPQVIFGNGGALDELQQWKAEGRIRYVGASAMTGHSQKDWHKTHE